MYNIVSFCGIFVIMLVAWLFSGDRRSVNWRAVFWGTALQLVFAFFVFRVRTGLVFFGWVNSAVMQLMEFARAGLYFVFGPLGVLPGMEGPSGEKSVGFILAFQALPLAVFFSSLMALLYHAGAMQMIVKAFSSLFTRFMRISGAESLCAASNILVGIESVFTVRPYLDAMTLSELGLVLTSGMATIASTVMAVYIGFLYSEIPTIAGHLVSASMLSAPAAIVMSKLVMPEAGKPRTLGRVVEPRAAAFSSWVEAVINGSREGVKLVVGIVALLLAFLGLLAMVNWAIGLAGQWVGGYWGISPGLSLQKIFGYVFYPLAFIMGVPTGDIPAVSGLLGERLVATELVAYRHLAALIKDGTIGDPRSMVIAAYSLCGFAHIASVAIFVGGTSALAPSRSGDLARLGFRALLAATLACLMTGAVAGVFISDQYNPILDILR